VLTVSGLKAGYGDATVLFGIELVVGAGEVVTLMGRNGMGKTTTIRAIMGLVRPRAGRVTMEGRELAGLPPYRIAQAGLGLVPEGRQIFPTLTVEENLVATAADRFAARRPWRLERVYELMPRLAERRHAYGRQLSGGEQQMLAIGRALMTNPKLLVLDEATEGLAPIVRAEIWSTIAALKQEGQAILIVDRNLDVLQRLADRHVFLERGRVAWTGDSAALAADRAAAEGYLGLSSAELQARAAQPPGAV
jgi:branched-chain amino acid transport system ATP-binding protein